jgi:hypothetical protein
MATVRQYFETDFSHVVRIQIKFGVPNEGEVEGAWLVDFLGYLSFLTLYVPGASRPFEYYIRLLQALEYGKAQLIFQGNIGLPSARQFPGALRVENKHLSRSMHSSLETRVGFRRRMSQCLSAFSFTQRLS